MSFRRQSRFSTVSFTTKSSLDVSFEDNYVQPKSDDLAGRLHKLLLRISKESALALNQNDLKTIHSKVDEIESILEEPAQHSFPKHESQSFTENTEPSKSVSRPREVTKPVLEGLNPGPNSMTTSKAVQIVQESTELNLKLQKTLSEYQKRREESRHIHNMLVSRCEWAAQKVIFLQRQIAEMNEDFITHDSELKFLRISLQAIETQCSQYISPDDFTASILSWKNDWDEVDRRVRARRLRFGASDASVEEFRDVNDMH